MGSEGRRAGEKKIKVGVRKRAEGMSIWRKGEAKVKAVLEGRKNARREAWKIRKAGKTRNQIKEEKEELVKKTWRGKGETGRND